MHLPMLQLAWPQYDPTAPEQMIESTTYMQTLTLQEIELLVIVVIALVLIVSNRLRPDLVALLVLLALGLSGILPPEQALAGFSRSAVIAIVGLFVISAALE